MNEKEVSALVEKQLAGRWNQTNFHGVDLKLSLVPPVKIPVILPKVIDGKKIEEIIETWLVLEENPETKDGYKIIYDETESIFGLAVNGKEQRLVVIGFYGDFWTTFEAM